MADVNINTDEMGSVSKRVKAIHEIVDEHFNTIDASLKEATDKGNWEGESSNNLQKNYDGVKSRLMLHLQQLGDLSPALDKIADGYTAQEEENTQQMRSNTAEERVN